jgi:hypothetical protein
MTAFRNTIYFTIGTRHNSRGLTYDRPMFERKINYLPYLPFLFWLMAYGLVLRDTAYTARFWLDEAGLWAVVVVRVWSVALGGDLWPGYAIAAS